jgi:hypothetical protein
MTITRVFDGSYDTLDEARAAAGRYDNKADWKQIIDSETGKEVA